MASTPEDVAVRLSPKGLNDVSGAFRKVLGDIKTVGRQAKTESSALSKLTAGWGRQIAGVAAAYFSLRGITSIVGAIIRNTSEAEAAQAQLEARIKSTRGAAGLTADQLVEMARRFQDATTFGDDEIVQAQAQLLTFTKVTRENFEQATEQVLNLSIAMGTDLRSSVTQIGKALNDPIAGLTSLTRSGIQFTAAQKQTIRSLVETGQTASAQRVILAELETQFGGAARAAKDTLGGALASLKNAAGDLLEADDGMPGVVGSINDLTKTLQDPAVKQGMQDLIALFARLASLGARAAASVGSFLAELRFDIFGSENPDAEIAVLEKKIQDLRDSIARERRKRERLGPLGALFGDGKEFEAEINASISRLQSRISTIRTGQRGAPAAGGERDTGGDGPGAVDPRIALRALQSDLQAAGVLLTDEIRRTREQLDADLATGLVSYSEFFQRRAALETQQIDQTLGQRRAALDLLIEEIRLLEERGEETEKQEAGRKKLVAEITVLERQRGDAATKAARDQAAAEKKLADELAGVATRLKALQGDSVGARESELEREFRDLLQRLQIEGDAAGEQIVRNLINVELAKARLDQLETDYARAMAEFGRQEQSLQTQVETGVISELEARRRAIELYEEQAEKIRALIPEMRALAEATGDPADVDRLREMEDALLGVERSLASATDSMAQFREGGLDAFQGGIEDMLKNVEDIESVGDAFRSLARTVVDALRDITAEIISTAARASALKFLRSFGGGFAQGGAVADGFADGGMVQGPGKPTADDKIIRVSSGEYIVRAAAVSKPGVRQMLDSLNYRLQLPRHVPRFARGGPVDSGAAAQAVANGKGSLRIVNTLSEDLITQAMGTPAGEQVILNTLERNPGVVQRLISRR